MQIRGTTALVTGANGFVGTRLSRRLLEKGAAVRALVRKAGGSGELAAAGATEIVGEFTEAGAAREATAGVDVVVHCAAAFGPDLAGARAVNEGGTRKLVAASRAAGAKRFVQISTVAVYDLAANPPFVDEDSPLKTEGDAYGITKAEADLVVLEAIAAGFPATILRPVAILGVHPTSTWSIKVPERVRDGKIPLALDGRNTWSWVHVENLADALVLALEKDAAIGRIYNVVDGQSTWRAFTDDIRRWFGASPLPTKSREELVPGQYWTGRFSSERLRRELGWTPRLSYWDGMGEAEAYWRAH
ncbi:MAG: NAD(P)-dependent oxidoreductase [bacterium]